MLQNDVRVALYPGSTPLLTPRPERNEMEIEKCSLELMDPTSKMRDNLKALKRLIFLLKPGQQSITTTSKIRLSKLEYKAKGMVNQL